MLAIRAETRRDERPGGWLGVLIILGHARNQRPKGKTKDVLGGKSEAVGKVVAYLVVDMGCGGDVDID